MHTILYLYGIMSRSRRSIGVALVEWPALTAYSFLCPAFVSPDWGLLRWGSFSGRVLLTRGRQTYRFRWTFLLGRFGILPN